MKLFICWGTCPVPGGHPCRMAYEALEQAGHAPQVIKAHGTRLVPDSVAERLPDPTSVPILLTDDDEVVAESRKIVAWAKQHPAAPTNAVA